MILSIPQNTIMDLNNLMFVKSFKPIPKSNNTKMFFYINK